MPGSGVGISGARMVEKSSDSGEVVGCASILLGKPSSADENIGTLAPAGQDGLRNVHTRGIRGAKTNR